MISINRVAIAASLLLTLGATTVDAADLQICDPGNGITGEFRGGWYSYFESSSQTDRANCDVEMKIYDDRANFHFRIE